MKNRFVITHVSGGLRRLTFANQGIFHYDTRVEAEAAMRLFEPDLRSKILGDDADTLKVLEVECYDHGDATRTIFHPPVPVP